MGYSGGGRRFSMNFSRNNPRSIRSLNGRMSFTNLRGGGMRVFVRNLRGARVGQPLTINPGSSALAERDASGLVGTSFRFTGFDGFGFTREQLLNDVPLFGQALARLIDSGFGSVNLLFQRLNAELLLQPTGTYDGFGTDFITAVLGDAALGIISGYPNPTGDQQVLTSAFDLVAFLDPLLRGIDLNGDGNVNSIDARLLVILEKFIAANAEKILELLNTLNLLVPLQAAVDARNAEMYKPIDPDKPGTVEFTDGVLAVLENAGTTYVYVTRKDGSAGEATATVSLDPSTTPDPSAFRFATQTVKWADGEAGPKAVALKVIDDRIQDGDVALSLNLASSTVATMGSLLTSQITIIDNDSASSNSAIAVARNAILVLEYSWPRNQKDLDTFTTFERGIITPDASVGFTPDHHALYAPYMAWSGDDTTGGGKEVVVIDLDSAISDGLLSPYTIECLADWYQYNGGSGPAMLSVYFKDKVTGRTSPKAVTEILPDIYLPATSSGGAQTHVADIDITYDSLAGSVEFTLTPITPSP